MDVLKCLVSWLLSKHTCSKAAGPRSGLLILLSPNDSMGYLSALNLTYPACINSIQSSTSTYSLGSPPAGVAGIQSLLKHVCMTMPSIQAPNGAAPSACAAHRATYSALLKMSSFYSSAKQQGCHPGLLRRRHKLQHTKEANAMQDKTRAHFSRIGNHGSSPQLLGPVPNSAACECAHGHQPRNQAKMHKQCTAAAPGEPHARA